MRQWNAILPSRRLHSSPPVAQPIININPGTFVGVLEDQELENLAYPSFRATLEFRFDFEPNLYIDKNKKEGTRVDRQEQGLKFCPSIATTSPFRHPT